MIKKETAVLGSAVLVFILIKSWVFPFHPVHPDLGYILFVAEGLLDGKQMYVDFIEVNFPSIYYFTTIPVFLSKWIGLSDINTYYSFLYGWMLFSVYLCTRLLPFFFEQEKTRTLFTLFLLYLVMLYPGYNFGQRDHLLFVFTLPYALLIGVRMMGGGVSRWTTVWIGLMAGIGLTFKPFFVLIYIVAESYVCISTKKISSLMRTESVFIVITNGLYYLFFVLFQLQNYFAVYQMARYFYNVNNNDWMAILYKAGFHVMVLYLIFYLFYRYKTKRITPPLQKLHAICWVFLTASLILLMIQQKGWDYHCIPFRAWFLIIGFIFLLRLNRSVLRRSIFHAVMAVGLLVCSLFPFYSDFTLGFRRIWHDSAFFELKEYVERHAKDQYIYVLSIYLNPTYPLVNYAPVKFNGRYPFLWPLTGVEYKDLQKVSLDPNDATVTSTRERLMSDLLEDLTEHPPALIVDCVDTGERMMGIKEFSYIDYFSQNEQLKRFFAQYSFKKEIQSKGCHYLVYGLDSEFE
ncbi:MAG: hypothetical protein JXR73_05885 [Candidatus Omnitrophica bacterium]|nr:hypothetical protein [Candidatus Omnitrophota bacterium]